MDKNIGKQGRDTVTKFVGTITGKSEHLEAASEYQLTPTVGAYPSEFMGSHWFPVGRVEILKSKKGKGMGF